MQTCARDDRMPTLRVFSDSPDDDELLLYPRDKSGRFNVFQRVHHDNAIAKGVANQLERWPSHLLFAFLAACLVLTGLILFVFVTVAFYLPITDDRWQNVQESLYIGPPKIYFVKSENRTWSTMDLCYIESAARENPDLDVYLINVMKQNPRMNRLNAIMIRLLGDGNDKATNFLSRMNYSTELRADTDPMQKLIAGNRNIRSVNVSIEKFFYRSRLSSVANQFNEEILETAAKMYLLWNTPGITLNTNMFCNLKRIRQFLCTENANCTLDTLATVDPENEIVATNVPCQAFLGFFVHQLSKIKTQSFTDQRYSLRRILNEFCPRTRNCIEVRMFQSESKCPLDGLNCPNVYSEYSKPGTETPIALMT